MKQIEICEAQFSLYTLTPPLKEFVYALDQYLDYTGKIGRERNDIENLNEEEKQEEDDDDESSSEDVKKLIMYLSNISETVK